jgi:rod shape-determining protein MreD
MMRRASGAMIAGSVLLGIVFALLPLPDAIGPARPYLLALLLAYWLVESPASVGLGTAFVSGLLADIALSTPLGEQALRLVVLTYLIQRFRARLRFFPLWQQALSIGLLLVNDRIIVVALHAILGLPQAPWTSWLSPVLGLLLWPWLFVLLDVMRQRQRARER